MLIPVLRRTVPIMLAVCFAVGVHALDFPWKFSRDASNGRLDPQAVPFTRFSLSDSPEQISWGSPLAGGPIRALFIAPRFALADVRAIADQLEMEPQILAYWDAEHLGRPEDARPPLPGTGTEQLVARLNTLLDRTWDVIVIANVDVTQIPSETFAAITKRVHDGTGLVLAHHRKITSPDYQAFLDALEPAPGADRITQGVGYQLAPEWTNGLGFVQSAQFGTGRVVELDFPGPRPLTHCLIPAITRGLDAEWEHFDTYLSLAARAIRWAASRVPETTIASVEPEPLPTPSAMETPVGLDTDVEGDALDLIRRQLVRPFIVRFAEPLSKRYTIRTRVRRPGRGTPVITMFPDIGGTDARVYLVAGTGVYYLDVWLLDGDDVVDWYTEAVVVDAWPVINNLTLNRTTLLSQDTLGLSFTMPPRPRPATVLTRATDPLGRVVAESLVRVPPDTGLVHAGLDLDDLIAGPVKVEVFALDRDAESFSEWDTTHATYAYRYLPVRGLRPDTAFRLIAHIDGSAEYNARRSYRVLANSGIDRAYTQGSETAVAFLAEANLNPVARVAQYTPERIVNGAVREPCFTDSAWIETETDRLDSLADVVRLAGATRLSLGDGNCLAAGDEPVCQSASAVDAYGSYLRTFYGSRAAAENATDHADQTGDTKAYDQWLDFRSFMDSVFVGRHADVRSQLKKLDNRLSVGFTTRPNPGPYTGYDWRELADALDWIAVPFDPVVVEKVRSYRQIEMNLGLEISSPLNALDEGRARWFPWYAALHGISELWLPPVLATSENVVPAPLIAPDGSPISQAPDLFREAQVLSSGVNGLLQTAHRESSGIAIYDSRASYYLDYAENSYGCDTSAAQRRFLSLLRRLGFQCDFVSSRDAVRGGLHGYNVLILPMVRAMADDEVAAIRAFRNSGGCLIADIAPGAYDAHGVPRSSLPLDDLFGVRHVKPPRAGAAAQALVQIDVGGTRASGTFEGLIPDAGVEATSAAVGGIAGTAPVWLINQSNGLTAFINHALPEAGESALVYATLLNAIVTAGGASRPLVVDAHGDRRFRGDVFGYTLDANRVVAVLADSDAPEQSLDIAFPDADSYYDLLNAIRVHRPKKSPVKLAGGAVALYSMLPYDVSGVTLETLPSAATGTRIPFSIRIETRNGDPSTHVVHVQLYSLVTDAVGPIPYYAQDLVCKDGTGEGYFRLALNERPGVYKLLARDVLTGTAAEAVVKVHEP